MKKKLINLLIVESPTKAKTISHFLEKDYMIESSFGHVRDLPKTRLGVDVEHDFAPTYLVPKKAKEHVLRLLEKAAKADAIYFATDSDREGEAIAWHISQILKTKGEAKRIIFHEITKDAILEALKNPRDINQDLVDAQQTRRILDRLVGYKLSPLLWKKVVRGLSAGRVQSVAVRLTVEREREIRAFKTQEYWTIAGTFGKKEDAAGAIFPAGLIEYQGKKLEKFDIPAKANADEMVVLLNTFDYEVNAVNERETRKKPLPPYRTSTLQQDAHNRLGFSSKQTMVLAQQLYEGVHLGTRGATGLITYMRTDSTTLANKFIVQSKKYLEERFGERYSFAKPRIFKNKTKGAQEAHEAIRPTDIALEPDLIKEHLDPRQHRLYTLIWQRALASLMPEAVMKNTVIDIKGSNGNDNAILRANGTRIVFDGFLKIYPAKVEETELPQLGEKETLRLHSMEGKQHFTEPPPRYNDASLVKELEKLGIGRPSTYAPTLETIVDRGYVERDLEKRFNPTDMGELVNDLLEKHFPNIVDYNFTAQMEKNLDMIAEKKVPWVSVIRDFYDPFAKQLEIKYKEIDKKELVETETDRQCPLCKKRALVIRMGRFGKFIGCPGYPECKYTEPIAKDTGDGSSVTPGETTPPPLCPNCKVALVRKEGRFGQFFGCPNYPACKHTERGGEKLNIPCPECKVGEIVIKRSRKGRIFYGCNRYPECTYATWKKP